MEFTSQDILNGMRQISSCTALEKAKYFTIGAAVICSITVFGLLGKVYGGESERKTISPYWIVAICFISGIFVFTFIACGIIVYEEHRKRSFGRMYRRFRRFFRRNLTDNVVDNITEDSPLSPSYNVSESFSYIHVTESRASTPYNSALNISQDPNAMLQADKGQSTSRVFCQRKPALPSSTAGEHQQDDASSEQYQNTDEVRTFKEQNLIDSGEIPGVAARSSEIPEYLACARAKITPVVNKDVVYEQDELTVQQSHMLIRVQQETVPLPGLNL